MTAEAKRRGPKKGSPGTIRVRLVKSTIGYNRSQALVVRGLGLRRIGHAVDVVDHPAMRGMIRKVRHLVVVEETDASGGAGTGSPR